MLVRRSLCEGERLIPETTDIEGADAPLAFAGNTSCRKCLCSLGLPGTFAHIEYPGTNTEQERLKGQPPFGRGGRSDARDNRSGAVSMVTGSRTFS